MPVRHQDLGDDLAPPEPKRCRHCDESRSSCGGGGGSEGSEGRASWRVTLDHDLVETLSAIYPEWFKQPRRERAAPLSPASPCTPCTPCTPPEDDTFSSCAEEMAGRPASGSGTSEPASPPRGSPPKVVVDDSPLQPAMDKHKESLKVKLMNRRSFNQLVEQGIMPPLKTPPAFFERRKQLERAKTGDFLKSKIQSRPDRQELERRHILEQESHVDPSLAEKQRMLKKARLADQLNNQISHRPGPLELIKKNILHTEENIETAVKSGFLPFKATSEGASGRPQLPSSYYGIPEEISPSPSPPSTLSPASVTLASESAPLQHAAPGKEPKKRKPKLKQQIKPRYKFHEYKGPTNAQTAPSPSGSTETPYELLLQQQQLLLQLMLPASPAPSCASATSDASDAPPPPPPALAPPALAPPAPVPLAARFDEMKVSDLRAECKRRNLRVSGPKPQLIDRLQAFHREMQEETPRSPSSVASPESRAESEPSEDIVQSQRRLIEELERQLEESRRQLEAVRREAAGAAASDHSRRLLHAYVCVTKLRARLDALQQPAAPAPPPPPPPRYVLAAPDAAPDRLVFTVTSPAAGDASDAAAAKSANPAYILNGVKVVPIAILPTAHYEPERAPPPPPPPPPPLPPANTGLHDSAEDSQIMNDVLEILVENGELPPSAVGDVTPNRSIDAGYLTAGSGDYTPTDVLGDDILGDSQVRDSLTADELQRELHDIMSHADLNVIGGRCDMDAAGGDIDAELNVDQLASNEFNANFCNSDSISSGHDDFLGGFETADVAMDVDDDVPERMATTPLANGDILDHTRGGFDDMSDLSLPCFPGEDTRPASLETRPCVFDFNDYDLSGGMALDGDAYEYLTAELIPNVFGRGHVPQCDPVLGGVLRPAAPRPADKHYSWDRIEYDAT